MDDNKPTQLWDQNCATPKELRLPKSNSFLGGESDNKNPISELIVKSRLSADAPEFVPSCLKQSSNNPTPVSLNSSANLGNSAPKLNLQDRLNRHRKVEVEVINNESENLSAYNSAKASKDMDRLKQLISTLTNDPEQFDDLAQLFLDTLYPNYDDIFFVSNTAKLLINQATSNPNFRYSGAKLCCLIEPHCPKFRAELHLTFKKELDCNPNKSGLLLFAAEMFIQLENENIYGNYLIAALKQLLDVGGNDNVKSVCQALKLTGRSLELYDKSALDSVFVKLQGIKPTVMGTALSLINSVINLRSLNWGYNDFNNSSSSLDAEPEHTNWQDPSDPTIYYNPDGINLTTEEIEFLEANLPSTDDFIDTSDPDELYNPEPEMDEEIQAAFKEFLKLSQR